MLFIFLIRTLLFITKTVCVLHFFSACWLLVLSQNCNFEGLLHHPFWLQLNKALLGCRFQFLSYFVWPRITDEGSVPEMRIWSISLILKIPTKNGVYI